MIRIAIIEDKQNEALQLRNCIRKYEKDNKADNIKFDIVMFESSEEFLLKNQTHYDIAFFDIDLPNLNGIDAAYRLRKYDNNTLIIFVTNTSQYALKGYKVNAIDYIIKPVDYNSIVSPLDKALNLIKNNLEMVIVIPQTNGMIRVNSREISYIEVSDHKLSYHTDRGVITGSGTLSELEKKLKSNNFMRCNSCYLVNPKYIESVEKYTVIMKNGDCLKISKPRKKNFMLELTLWLGQGNFI